MVKDVEVIQKKLCRRESGIKCEFVTFAGKCKGKLEF
jgi:hypothetical protein